MSTVKDLFIQSQQIIQHLQQELPTNEAARDEYILLIEQLLEDRQTSIDKISNYKPNEDDVELGKEILKLNRVIEGKLTNIQQQIKKDINVFKAKKAKNRKYDNPYEGPTLQGAFIDKRNL